MWLYCGLKEKRWKEKALVNLVFLGTIKPKLTFTPGMAQC